MRGAFSSSARTTGAQVTDSIAEPLLLPPPGDWSVSPSEVQLPSAPQLDSQLAFPTHTEAVDEALISSVTSPVVQPPLSQASSLQDALRSQGKIFLDVCCGSIRPFSFAALKSNFPVLSVDPLLEDCIDVSVDNNFELLLRICFSGLVWFAFANPPVHEVTLPGDNIGEELPTSVLDRCTTLLLAVFQSGGHVCLVQPSASQPWKQPLVQHFLLEISAACIVVDAADWSGPDDVQWLFASSFQSLSSVSAETMRVPSASAPNLKHSAYVAFPAALASQVLQLISPLHKPSEASDLSLRAALGLLPIKDFGVPPFSFQDGGGMGSSPDWSCPPCGMPNKLAALRQSWLAFLFANRIPSRLREHIEAGGESNFFTQDEIVQLRVLFGQWASSQGGPSCIDWSVDPEQPYCLRALQVLSTLLRDPDRALFPALIEGVPTGFDRNIPDSNVFAKRADAELAEVDLLLCEGNWSSAEANPAQLEEMVGKEVQQGFLQEVPLEDALRRWPDRCAVGKMSIVSSEGRPGQVGGRQFDLQHKRFMLHQ